MLENLRANAQSWIAKLILGGIILSFALWGIADYFLGSRLEPVAKVDGEPISPKEFAEAYERQAASLRQLLGKEPFANAEERKLFARNVLQQLIQRRLVQAEAEKIGLVVPDEIVAATVQITPAFQSAGSFDPERYRLVVRALGFATPQDYERALRVDILIDQLRRLLENTAFVGEKELWARFLQENERRELAAIVIDPDAMPEPKVTAEEARAWYQAHKEQYMAPAKVALDIVVIDPKAMAEEIEPSLQELQRAYEEEKARYRTPEAWKLLHLFVRGTDEAAKKRFDALQKRIENGEDFLAVAQQSDEASPELGWVQKGALDPALEKAIAGLKAGEISKPVKNARGWHLFKVLAHRKAGVRPFAEVRKEIEKQIKLRKAEEEAADLADALDDALGRFDHLRQAADEVGLKVRSIGPIAIAEAALDPALQDARLQQRLKTMQPGDPIDLLELDDGRIVAMEVRKRIAPQARAFDEVADLVVSDLKEDKRRKLARKRAEELLAQAKKEGLDARALAKKAGVAAYFTEPIGKAPTADAPLWLTPEVRRAAFDAAAGSWIDAPIETPLGVVIVRVVRRIAPGKDAFSEAKEELKRRVLREKGAVRFARWIASLQQRHEVEINEAALASLVR